MNREAMIQRQQELLDAARAAGRELTAAEQAEFNNLQRQIDALDGNGGAPGTGNGAQATGSDNGQRGAAAVPQNQNGPEGTGAASDNGESVRQAAQREERARIREIQTMCSHFGMDATEYINNGTSVNDARAAIMTALIQRNGPLGQNGSGDVNVTASAEDKYRAAAVDALLIRGGVNVENPAEGARDLVGMSLRDIAVESLSADGLTGYNRRSADDIFTALMQRQYYNPSAAFPAIMDNAIKKAYVEGHRAVAVTFDKWTKKGTLSDFKTADNNYLAGPAGEFLEVPEGGELKHDVPRDEKRPTRKLKTYGRQFTMSRQAFINDDIGLVTRIPAKYAASARKTINKQCCQILVSNPTIYDGTKLFTKAHGNFFETGSGITRESMQAMMMALQTQRDEFGEAIIVRPAVILVPVGYAFDMYTLFFSPTINTAGNTQAVNPLYRYREQIEIVEEPTLNVLSGGFGKVMPWFLFGAASDTDGIEVDYLNGVEIPSIRRMETSGVLGFVWDIYLDWGINVMDYRGIVKNTGVKLDSPLGSE